MAAPRSSFSFPPNFDLKSLPKGDSQVCVVSIVGKSHLSPYASKASHFNPIIDKDVFMEIPEVAEDSVGKGDVECYYDVDNSVIYLHFRSLYDVHRTALLCQKISREECFEEFLPMWQKEEYRHARTLLWMFTVSHIIVMSTPGNSFDVSYVRLFRTLDTIRLKLQHCLSEQLQMIPAVSKDWCYSGRPCSPRVLFVFETTICDLKSEEDDRGAISKVKKSLPIKKLQHAIEDQIYRILRKSRVITNISNNSLFAVPANQEFVFVHTKVSKATDPVSFYLNMIRLKSPQIADKESSTSKQYPSSEVDKDRSKASKLSNSSENSFKDFLWQHIDLALGRGFDDNVGRNPVQPIFEIVTTHVWFMVATQLYSFFFGDPAISKSQGHFNTLKSLLETDIRFSENRCNKVLPIAEGNYQEGLPPNYVTNFHLSKLAQAHRVFYQLARGPACQKYAKQLEEACEKYWRNGRQLCEEISITGNHCVNPFHRLPDEPCTDENANLPIMPHCSQLKIRVACNCGRMQADKDDPFDHKFANYEFYMDLESQCCSTLEHIELPVFKPSTPEGEKADSNIKVLSVKVKENVMELEDTKDIENRVASLSLGGSLQESDAGGSEEKSVPYSLKNVLSVGDLMNSIPEAEKNTLSITDIGNSASQCTSQDLGLSGTQDMGHNETVDTGQSSSQDHHRMVNQRSPKKEPIEEGSVKLGLNVNGVIKHSDVQLENMSLVIASRQPSTIDYLQCMVNSESPEHLLPKFPSWSICCLGKGTMYNHNAGLDLPGFLHGSNFLLPWDITVKAEKEKWPSIGETTSRRSRHKRSNRVEVADINLRIYLGDEYECPRGHRFFCSGPEKVIKVSSNSTVKDNANKLISMDMPLYCPCPHCRSTKGYIAQLMRLYIVTPDGPARVSVNPSIVPGLPRCPTFTMGFQKDLELPPGGLWVVRLPHIYVDDNVVYTMPTEAQYLQHCKMLKGVYGYRDVNKDP